MIGENFAMPPRPEAVHDFAVLRSFFVTWRTSDLDRFGMISTEKQILQGKTGAVQGIEGRPGPGISRFATRF
jgi:hypothetical protein